MKPKWIIISATCISIASAVGLGKITFVKGEVSETSRQSEPLDATRTFPMKESTESRINVLGIISRNNLSGVNLDRKIRIEDSMQEVKDFTESQGYGIQFGESSYQYYPIDTLRDLTESGDFVASHILAKKLLEEGDHNGAMQSYKKAATLGSTAALTSLASLYKAEYHQSEINSNSSAKDAALINVIAYYNLAIKRGDIGAQTRKEVFLDVYNIELTSHEKSLASKKADIIYKEILRKRRELGLASFEDENSSVVKDFFR